MKGLLNALYFFFKRRRGILDEIEYFVILARDARFCKYRIDSDKLAVILSNYLTTCFSLFLHHPIVA